MARMRACCRRFAYPLADSLSRIERVAVCTLTIVTAARIRPTLMAASSSVRENPCARVLRRSFLKGKPRGPSQQLPRGMRLNIKATFFVPLRLPSVLEAVYITKVLHSRYGSMDRNSLSRRHLNFHGRNLAFSHDLFFLTSKHSRLSSARAQWNYCGDSDPAAKPLGCKT